MRLALEAVQGSAAGPELLANAALDRLRLVLASAGDRSAAFDLLAADALLTQACEAAAEKGPEALREFAQELVAQITGLLPQQGADGEPAQTAAAAPTAERSQ
jgi:hypothetical protein